MGKTFARKFIAVLVTLTLVLSSYAIVFADDSPGSGSEEGQDAVAKITSISTEGYYSSKTFTAVFKGTDCAKYRIAYRKAGGKWIIKETTKNSFSFSASTNGLYQIKVRGITKAGKAGAYSVIRSRYMGRVTPTVTSPSKGKIKVTAKKCSGVTGYVITYSTNKNMSGAKTVTVNTTKNLSKVIKVTSKKTYYVQVRPICKKGGFTYQGLLSATKTRKAK